MKAERRTEILARLGRLRMNRSVEARGERNKLETEYLAALPRVAVSRCPFTDQVLRIPIDTDGLDGPFWDEMAPVRPLEARPLPSLFALTGAVALDGEIPQAPFPCTPGPQVPFVVPRMLLHPDVRAVISQVQVGRHRAFPIAYFADPVPVGLQRFNDWGTNEYSYETDDAPELFDSIDEEDEALDFDIGPWIERGDLSWIAPGDNELSLRSSVADCPFVGLDGRRDFYWIQNGKISSLSGG